MTGRRFLWVFIGALIALALVLAACKFGAGDKTPTAKQATTANGRQTETGSTATESATGEKTTVAKERVALKPGVPPDTPHMFDADYAACSSCHKVGEDVGFQGGTDIPKPHEGRSSTICKDCHKPPVPPKSEHDFDAAHQACTICHQVGKDGVGVKGGMGMRESHERRTEQGCRSCHESSKPLATPKTPAPVSTAKPVALTPGVPPAASHAFDNEPYIVCGACHTVSSRDGEGVIGGVSMPVTHIGLDTICQNCHKSTWVMPQPSHAFDAAHEPCSVCHELDRPGVGVKGGLGMPESHRDRPTDKCAGCHQTGAAK